MRRARAHLNAFVLEHVGPYRRWYGGRLMEQGLLMMGNAAARLNAMDDETSTVALLARLDFAMGDFRFQLGKAMATGVMPE